MKSLFLSLLVSLGLSALGTTCTVTNPNDFDRVARGLRERGDEIILQCDVFTSGPWDRFPGFVQLADGLTLKGNGHRIELRDPVVVLPSGLPRPDRDVSVLHVGSDCVIENVVLDGNEAAWRAGPREAWLFVNNGLRSFGRITATDVHVQGIRGADEAVVTLTRNIEAFGFLINGSDVGGSRLTRCSVTQCPSADSVEGGTYISAFIIGHGDKGKDVPLTIVQDCLVDVSGAWCAFSASRSTLFTNCVAKRVRTAANFDTYEMANVLFEDCVFKGIKQGPSLVSTDGSAKKNITFRGCVFSFGSTATHVCSLWDQYNKGGQLGPLVFDNCQFQWNPGDKPVVATAATNLRPIVFNRSPLPDGYVFQGGESQIVFAP